ncbi:MAG: hypothetical protein P1U32_00810 [Legionellaceae bacterium]|nr:hypothetical protein [Legionellaceae bacterium]
MAEIDKDFITRTKDRLVGKWDKRAHNASKAYNFFLSPNTPLGETTPWFNPFKRGHFEGFKSGEFMDDLKSLIFKPIIFFGLRLVEMFNVVYYFLAFLFYAVTFRPSQAVDAIIDSLEALVATPILEIYTSLEIALQMGSFAMRCILSVFDVLKLDEISRMPSDVVDSTKGDGLSPYLMLS